MKVIIRAIKVIWFTRETRLISFVPVVRIIRVTRDVTVVWVYQGN